MDSLAAIITALTGFVVAIGSIVATFAVLLKKSNANGAKLDEVHLLVNSQLTKQIELASEGLKRINKLENLLTKSGIDVPQKNGL